MRLLLSTLGMVLLLGACAAPGEVFSGAGQDRPGGSDAPSGALYAWLETALPVRAGASEEHGPRWVFFSDKTGDALGMPCSGSHGLSCSGDFDPPGSCLPPMITEHHPMQGDGDAWRRRPVCASYLAALRERGLTVRHVIRGLNAASVSGVDEEPAYLAHEAFVQRVVPVARRMTVPGVHSVFSEGTSLDGPRSEGDALADYGVSGPMMAAGQIPELRALGLTGQGVRVAVLDTGFDFVHEAVVDLQDQVVGSWDFVSGDEDVTPDGLGDHGEADHGTRVLAVLAGRAPGSYLGAAPDIEVLLARTEELVLEAPLEEDRWVAGVEWAEQQGAQILSSSLGWLDWYGPQDMDGATAVSTVFIEDLVAQTGLVVVQAAGNEGPGETSLFAPADAASVLTVGATDLAGELASFSGRGPTADGRLKPDLLAVGKEVPIVSPSAVDGTTPRSGTSYATPLVAGAAALLLEARPDWGREELIEALLSTATRADAPDAQWGHGSLQAFAACGLACSCVDADSDGFWAIECGGSDCDDFDAELSPQDADGDGFSSCEGDCDDQDPERSPVDGDGDGGSPCDGDCDDADPQLSSVDLDGDGVSSCDGDCVDDDPSIGPGATEQPYDGIDQDCDGSDLIDVDGDGWNGGPGGMDCGDGSAAVFPAPDPDASTGLVPLLGGHELCGNGRDDDCDLAADAADPDCSSESPEESLSGAAPSSGAGCHHAGFGRCDVGGLLAWMWLLCGLGQQRQRRLRRNVRL